MIDIEIIQPLLTERTYVPACIGRNGRTHIGTLEFHEFRGGVRIAARTAKRKTILNGGFVNIQAEDLDHLCRAWLKARRQQRKEQLEHSNTR